MASNILAVIFGSAALIAIVRDLRGTGSRAHKPAVRAWRALPFAVIALISIAAAGRAPRGRHAMSFDLSLAAEDLARSMTKVAHFRSIAILFLLAVVAVGVRRLWPAFLLTMLVGVGWELAESTVVGHYARLADLSPNVVSGLATLALVAWLRRSVGGAARPG